MRTCGLALGWWGGQRRKPLEIAINSPISILTTHLQQIGCLQIPINAISFSILFWWDVDKIVHASQNWVDIQHIFYVKEVTQNCELWRL